MKKKKKKEQTNLTANRVNFNSTVNSYKEIINSLIFFIQIYIEIHIKTLFNFGTTQVDAADAGGICQWMWPMMSNAFYSWDRKSD